MKDLLSKETLSAACNFLPRESIFFEKCGVSTNQSAKDWARAGGSGMALFAVEEQSAGRGRMGRTFYSPAKTGVYFSLAKVIEGPFRQTDVSLTCAAAVAVRKAILTCCGVDCRIKWVNDLLLGGKKICGILTETVVETSKTAIIIGVGVNLRPMKFPGELAAIAGSVGDTETPRAAFIAAVVQNLIGCISNPVDQSWLEEYRRASCTVGKRILYTENGKTSEAVATGIEPDGGLRIVGAEGERILRTGEITLRTQEE